MVSYKQTIKEKSRWLVWKHAIDSLTCNRSDNRILNTTYMDHQWEYVKSRVNEFINDEYAFNESCFTNWKSFSDIVYGKRDPKDLKVAFFCGPEPENDVRVLLHLGVRIENIYAFENDKKIFKTAVNSLHATYPLLKIFNGRIEDFIVMNAVKFDIVYLDFTGSLIKEFKTVIKLIDSNVLTPLSILAINTTYPDISGDCIQFLSHYFYNRTYFEHDIIKDASDTEEQDGRFAESCSAYGIYSEEDLETYIGQNFESAYSAFQTDFINLYSNLIKPIYSVVNNEKLIRRLFSTNNISKVINDKDRIGQLLQDYTEDGLSLISYWIEGLNIKEWKNLFYLKDNGNRYSRYDAALLYDIYDEAEYHNFQDILSDVMQIALPQIDSNLVGGRNGLFCDVPMIHLWLEQIVNQYGYPYHINMKNHRRYCYTAKTRKMCLDIFTLDSCRALYDWLPMIEYYAEDLSTFERQLISRMCMDAIGKHTIYILDKLYFGSVMVGIDINGRGWNANYCRPDRIEIK